MRHAPARPWTWQGGLLALALLLPGAASAQEQTGWFDGMFDDVLFSSTLGMGYSNGDYGTARNTNVEIGLPVLSAATDDFKFSVSMPYMRVSGRGLVVFDATGNPIVVNRRTTLPPITRTGFGDLNLGATYSVPSSFLDDFEVKLSAGIKVPTASTRRRLSTGETDFTMSIDVTRQFDAWGPFVKVGYLIPGRPATFKLFDTVSVSAGTSYTINDNLVAVASYDFDSASTPLVTASHQAFGSLSWIRENGMTLTGYGTIGLSSGSPAIGAGLLVSYNLN